ncbi:hypothetical protein D3C87_1382370 [compost metagenome]
MRTFKKVAAVASVMSVIAFASASHAQVFSLSPSSVTGGSVTLSSPAVYLSQTTGATCAVSLSGTVAGTPGSASLSGVTRSIGGSFPCGFPVVYAVGTWTVTAVSATTKEVDVHIEASTIIGDPCRGTVRLKIEPDNRTVYLDAVQIPADSGRADRVCTIDGELVANKDIFIL